MAKAVIIKDVRPDNDRMVLSQLNPGDWFKIPGGGLYLHVEDGFFVSAFTGTLVALPATTRVKVVEIEITILKNADL